MTAVLGTPVRYQQVPFEGFAGQLAGYGMPASYVQAIVEMMKAKNEAIYNAPPRIADPAMPTTFRQWCEDTLAPAARA